MGNPGARAQRKKKKKGLGSRLRGNERSARVRGRKKQDSRKLTPQQWQAQENAEQIRLRRIQCNYYQFWRVCTQRGCARARGCAGDPQACFERWLPHVPEEVKVQTYALLRAFVGGASKAEAAAAAAAELARWRELQAQAR